VPKLWRISDRATFGALRRHGRRLRRGPLALTWLPADPGTRPRVAFAVGRRVGGAVVRNRLRRRLRSAVQTLDPPLGPGAYLVSAAPEAADLDYDSLRTVLMSLVAEAHPAPRATPRESNR